MYVYMHKKINYLMMGLESRYNKVEVDNPSDEFPYPPQPEFGLLHNEYMLLFRQIPKIVFILATMALSCLVFNRSSITSPFSSDDITSVTMINHLTNSDNDLDELKGILNQATLGNNTVIITNVNDAWAKPHLTFDLLLESFRTGIQTNRFLKHLVVVSWDQKAYVRCLELHLHCYIIKTHGMDFSSEAHFMAADYLNIVWRKIDFLRTILELGYSFVFTDTDMMWFRDPFLHFDKDADIQIACDTYNGNPFDLKNLPNSGFKYVKSNKKTIEFYKFWYNSRMAYPGLHDQDVFNMIKFNQSIKDMGLEIRFLDTAYFGGFCEPSKDLNKVCTMHANCCFGLKNKVHDLGVMLSDWQNYIKLLPNQTPTDESKTSWTTARRCRDSFNRFLASKKKDGQGRKH